MSQVLSHIHSVCHGLFLSTQVILSKEDRDGQGDDGSLTSPTVGALQQAQAYDRTELVGAKLNTKSRLQQRSQKIVTVVFPKR